MPDYALLLLAAGNSVRMGKPKQLLPYRGEALIRHAAKAALASRCSPVVVVLGANTELVRPAIADLPVHIAQNLDWELGMGTSIQCGLRAIEALPVDGAILALADQPLINEETYNTLLRLHEREGSPIVSARYAGTFGVPVFFHRDAFPALYALAPGQGCKGVIQSHTEKTTFLNCPEAEADIDTPEDYQRLALADLVSPASIA